MTNYLDSLRAGNLLAKELWTYIQFKTKEKTKPFQVCRWQTSVWV